MREYKPYFEFELVRSMRIFCDEAYETAKDSGFHEEEHPITHYLMLVVTELAEAVEADRNGIPEGSKGSVSEEIADVFIRLADYCGMKEIDIGLAIIQKMSKNKKREFKHGKKY